jgi:hypothetical protein
MSRTSCLLFAAIVLTACGGKSAEQAASQSTMSPGERMYREGVLQSGEPMTAIVAGDVPIVGTQFSCESCHGRSGMGAAEGFYVVPPVAGQFLFNESPQPKRPAYDRESLAQLLREGVTPSGRVLSTELMPRYDIADADVDDLIDYLEGLSASDSPGVNETTIRFATIVTDAIPPDERDAVVGLVRRFGEDINRQTRNDSERWDRGYTPESKLPTVFREWAVDEWLLRGPSEHWAEQLEEYYERAPVFAVVGGAGDGSWEPVNDFCERRKLPCLYPSTDLPARDDDDFYTVYYSRALWLEADLIATHLEQNPVASVTQVWCDDMLQPVAHALEQVLTDAGARVESITFDCDAATPRIADTTATVLWLDRDHVEAVMAAAPTGRIYVSSTLLDRDVSELAGDAVFAAHPYRLPGKPDPALRRFELWATSRGVDITNPRRQAEAFFACLVINDAVKHMGRFRIREFALDMMDHGESMSVYVPLYPRPSFGPGQRYINKGGYILPVVDGQPVTSDAIWITP